MPGMNGLEFLEAIAERPGSPPVVMISGHGDVQTAVEAVRRGAVNFLEKPLDDNHVLVTLHAAIRERRLALQNTALKKQLGSRWELIGESEAMQHLKHQVEQVAGRAGISKATFFRYFESLGAMRYDAVARMVDLVRRRMAGQIREHFAPELRERSQARRDDLVALIAMLTSVESWDQFRNVYGRSPLQTRRTWTHAIDALLRRTAP